MRANRLVVAAVVAALAAVTSTVAAPADADSGAAPGRSKREDTVRYWTPGRVARAVHRDVVVDPMSGRIVPQGKGAKPGGGGGTTTSVTGSTWTKGGAVMATTGKVLFTLPAGDYVCSASVVDNAQAGGRSVVLTAGHCVNEGGGAWATNWMFIPDFQHSPHDFACATTPYGCWTAEALVSSAGWAQSGNLDYDVAFAVVGTGGKGPGDAVDLDDAVGTQGIAFNLGRLNGVTVHGFGYPAATPYTGNTLTYCAGRTSLDPWSLASGLGCNMTGGSSGGPWYRTFDEATGRGVATSLNSFKYTSDRRTMYGPYFGNWAQSVYATATSLSGTGNTAVAPPSVLP